MNDRKKVAKIFKALSDENRLCIIELLQTGEKCACHISQALGIPQSKLSYHMKILCESDIVSCYYLGKWTHYNLKNQGLNNVTKLLEQITIN